jgi:hypothetical protein
MRIMMNMARALRGRDMGSLSVAYAGHGLTAVSASTFQMVLPYAHPT